MRLRKGVLESFDSGAYITTVQLASSYKVYLEEVVVTRNPPSTETVTGSKMLMVFFDEHNAKEEVVIAVDTLYPI